MLPGEKCGDAGVQRFIEQATCSSFFEKNKNHVNFKKF
jgi:hypothetical protein